MERNILFKVNQDSNFDINTSYETIKPNPIPSFTFDSVL